MPAAYVAAADLAEQLVDARAEEGAARVDADDGELLVAGVLLEDLVSDARDGARHLLGRQDDDLVGGSGVRHKKAPPCQVRTAALHPLSVSRDVVKGRDPM